jgi:pentatricopeptide repeat protein
MINIPSSKVYLLTYQSTLLLTGCWWRLSKLLLLVIFRFRGCFPYTDLIFLETVEGNVQTSLKGFHHWEVRKELQDAYNALINAAGQAGKHKLAESLFSEVPPRQAHEC